MFKRIIAILIVISMAISMMAGLSSCGGSKKTRYEASFLELFDTVTRIVAYTDSKEEFTRYSQLIYDNLKVYHQLYDIYNNYPGINNIKTINDNAGIKPVKVDKRIIDLLLFGKEWYKKSEGRKNIAMGSVLSIWHTYREAGLNDEEHAELPPMDKLKEAARHMDINKVIIDQAASTVYLEDPKMSLDVGSIAKGYATERVTQIAIKAGFTSGLISVGGNVRAIGSKEGRPWNLGIQNPDLESPQKSIRTVYLTDMSLVTSGVYERYYTVNGKKYHHIIDPATLFPTESFTAVTIVCKDSGMADALTTTIFNLPYEKGLKLVNSLPDTGAMWIMKNGDIKYSPYFAKFLK